MISDARACKRLCALSPPPPLDPPLWCALGDGDRRGEAAASRQGVHRAAQGAGGLQRGGGGRGGGRWRRRRRCPRGPAAQPRHGGCRLRHPAHRRPVGPPSPRRMQHLGAGQGPARWGRSVGCPNCLQVPTSPARLPPVRPPPVGDGGFSHRGRHNGLLGQQGRGHVPVGRRDRQEDPHRNRTGTAYRPCGGGGGRRAARLPFCLPA